MGFALASSCSLGVVLNRATSPVKRLISLCKRIFNPHCRSHVKKTQTKHFPCCYRYHYFVFYISPSPSFITLPLIVTTNRMLLAFILHHSLSQSLFFVTLPYLIPYLITLVSYLPVPPGPVPVLGSRLVARMASAEAMSMTYM